MEDEHLDTVSTTKLDEFIKSSVENLIPNPSESEGEYECDVPACFTTFSNVLFDADYDFDSGDDHDSRIEEIDLSFTPDDPMPSGIKEDDYDSKRDIPILEELLDNYSLSLPENESYHFDIPLSSRPPVKPPDGNTRILNIKMMGDISKQKGLENFQPSAECPMMINGNNTPILDVPLPFLSPLINSSMGELGQAQRPKTSASWEHAYP
nr:hypothetical protein [Tanacetum cinerariifolium]